ncbi:MAG: hypothetical protein C5B52_07780 [Bacteroidetes bacterium]|nr:MAG: hypothetical protein C5B52_07780 [Bacteroidota bacterium]
MNEEEILKAEPKDEQAFRVASLIAGYLRDELSPDENSELDDWVTANIDNQKIFEKLTDPAQLKKMLAWKEKLDMAEALKRTREKIESARASKSTDWSQPWKFAAAAILLLTISIVLVSKFVLTHADEEASTPVTPGDIPAGSNHATLILGNGSQINLDSNSKGILKGATVAEIDNGIAGELQYRIAKNDSSSVTPENTLIIPAGGQFKIRLSDGTTVWLNSKSSLRYPEKFVGPKRAVILEGEAYFEVEKDPAHPFIVSTGAAAIEVLGTHFNVNAYSDNLKTTISLAEGKLRVNQSVTLEPGQEAVVDSSGTISKDNANLESALAWKNGLFDFKNSSLKEIMPQISRWYDATIQFDAQIPEHFNATIQRSVPVSKLLHILEETGAVHFNIKDKTIIVSK